MSDSQLITQLVTVLLVQPFYRQHETMKDDFYIKLVHTAIQPLVVAAQGGLVGFLPFLKLIPGELILTSKSQDLALIRILLRKLVSWCELQKDG